VQASIFISHALAWMGPTVALTGLILARWAWSRRQLTLVWGWWGGALALLVSGGVAQGVCTLGLRWPDGSMAGYGVLVAVLALAQALLARGKND
jgi:hypothetical protein